LPEYVSLVSEDEYITTSGEFLRFYVQLLIGQLKDRERVLEEIEKGKRNYLFDDNGDFINHSSNVEN
jgi:hypothetical protein